ncbi:uncharacterized protein LOC125240132 [Leguminivora glycinivorella]|uniref:uncharacterized protein LOC125240132 n=1 Tax=Leguminivora glycinivorella TaxID=1035111 RepID=UPI00200D94B9|nr:uncharacterized protein LOC125240132 [Leguminivora glycinivorella]
MAASRLCVFLALLVCAKVVAAQSVWCDLMCDDDDDDDYSDEDVFGDIFGLIFDPCSGCSSKPTKSKTTTPAPGMQQPLSIVIPPANGVNLTMLNTGTSWLMNFMPWPFKPSASAPSTTAAPATTAGTKPAGNTTAPATTAKPYKI